jgi:hypothetical protein
VIRSVPEAEAAQVGVPVVALEEEAAAARVAGRVEARAVGLEPEAEAEAEPGEPEGHLVEELAARAAPGERVELVEPEEQVVARVVLVAAAEERAGREEATTTTRTRMR